MYSRKAIRLWSRLSAWKEIRSSSRAKPCSAINDRNKSRNTKYCRRNYGDLGNHKDTETQKAQRNARSRIVDARFLCALCVSVSLWFLNRKSQYVLNPSQSA